MYFVDGGEDVLLGVRLHMAGDDVRAGVAELLHIAHGTLDHQVDIQRQVGGGADGLDHRDADGDIGHEQTVHHVHMDVVGGGDFFNVPRQIGEIGGQDGGGDLDHGYIFLSRRSGRRVYLKYYTIDIRGIARHGKFVYSVNFP